MTQVKDLSVTKAIVIPTFNESEALPQFLRELLPVISITTAIVIADDSAQVEYEKLKECVRGVLGQSRTPVLFSHNEGKGGRGAAVKRGFILALETFPELTHLLECDADGSHQPYDIEKLMKADTKFDLVIGSRYVKTSQISNWPKSRRIFSKFLNKIIPIVLGLDIKDVTNGLRRYSVECAHRIVNTNSINTGFIYLSEQALIATNCNFQITEVPIHFTNRILGESTVTYKEIISSVVGIASLLPLRIRNS